MRQYARRSRFAPRSPGFAFLALAFLAALPLAAEEAPPPVRVRPLAPDAARPAVVSRTPPAAAPDLSGRLLAARSAARAAGQPVPQPLAAASAAREHAALADRIGRDVRLVARPGAGTPAQIAGTRLRARVSAAESPDAAGDPDLATARAFLRENRSLLGLADPDGELALSARLPDPLGARHLRFAQRWNGVAVWPAEVIVHLDRDGNVDLLDGAYVPTPNRLLRAPVVAADDAVRRARAARESWRRAAASVPTLVVYAPGNRRPKLAWKIELSGAPDDAASVLVDAVNGAILATVPLVMTENVAGSGRDLFGQTVTLNVWHAGAGFELIDTSKPSFHAGCNVEDLTQNCGAIYVRDAANTPPNDDPDLNQADIGQVTSTSATSWAPADAVSAASNFSKVYDYYKQRHGRDAIDGNGGNILAVTRLGANFQNAFWTDDIGGMFFGDAEKYAGSLDVVGHEMTHGVTSKTAGLIYQDQAGALNEALSDIFGEMVERFATGSNDWLVGSQISPLRNMANPGQFGDPATMSEFVSTTQDSGGVHTNSGIINHAYYLLAEGEAGAIGPADAERIFYRALTLHLTKNSQFLDARLACIQSADELFGAGSVQSQRTAQAFDGVEILGSTPAPPPPTTPPVNGADSVMFAARNGANLVLSRRENAKGDPAQGVFLFATQPIAEEKIAVSGDGTLGLFVTPDNDACFFNTDATGPLSCLGLPGTIASVAMTRDAEVYALVLFSSGLRENLIRVIDLAHDATATYTLEAPATDAGSAATVLFADTLEFTANRRFLFYDALSELSFGGGPPVGNWSVSALDFANGQTYTIVPPIERFDVGNPAVARTNDNFVTFEADRQSDGLAGIFGANVATGDLTQIVSNVPSGPVTPVYTGNDNGIVYSYPDSSAPTGRSLALERVAADRLTPVGNPQPNYLFDGALPLIYRRGAFSGPAGNCTANATTLCLSGGRFQVTATFTTNQGQQGVGQAVRLTPDTGYFTFFQASNVEVILKVLNACAFSQRVWVFAGGLTNVATVLTVTDTVTGVSRVYANPQDTPFEPIQDTDAFATCFAGSIAEGAGVAAEAVTAPEAYAEIARLLAGREAAARGEAPAAAEPAGFTAEGAEAAAAAPTAACVPDAHSLCLSNGRFRVQTTFRTPQGQTGSGNAVAITGDTGYFWFFSASNVEMVAKVLNACSFSGHQWVFAGGLTNVEVTTTVTDTQTGAQKTYVNALNHPFQPLQDTAAFSTCP